MPEPMTCGRRFETAPLRFWPTEPPNEDQWLERGGLVGQEQIGLGCSHCGSLHPDALIEKLREGWILGGTDKPYKWYLEEPYTQEQKDELAGIVGRTLIQAAGAMRAKFYTAHLTMHHWNDILELDAAGTLRRTLYVQPWIPASFPDAPSWLRGGE